MHVRDANTQCPDIVIGGAQPHLLNIDINTQTTVRCVEQQTTDSIVLRRNDYYLLAGSSDGGVCVHLLVK